MTSSLRDRVRAFGECLRRHFERLYGDSDTQEHAMGQKPQTLVEATSQMKSSADHGKRVAAMINRSADKKNNAELLESMLARLDNK
jgi:hypothetical protein